MAAQPTEQEHEHSYGEYQRRQSQPGGNTCPDCRAAANDYHRNYRLARGKGRAFNFPVNRPSRLDGGLGATIARSFRESA